MSDHNKDWRQFLPNLAISGNFFRTVAYALPHVENMQTWLEADKHPLTCLWRIREIDRRPNLRAEDEENEYVVERKTIEENLNLTDALEKLAEYELTQKALGFTQFGKTAKNLGDEHVAQFAKNEGCIIARGKLYPVVNGRIAGDGIFPENLDNEAKNIKAKAGGLTEAAGNFDLSHLFRSHAQVEDFSRLLDSQADLEKWKAFVKNIGNVISALDKIQYSDYKTEKKSVSFLYKDNVVIEFKKLQGAITYAEKDLDRFPFLNEVQKQMCRKFFQEALLSYEVGYSKRLYRGHQREKDTETRNDLENQIKKTAKLCREYGGSDVDVQRIQAYVISDEMDVPVRDRPIYQQIQGNVSIKCSTMDTYFIPDSLFGPLLVLQKITAALEKKLADERSFLIRMPAYRHLLNTPNAENLPLPKI